MSCFFGRIHFPTAARGAIGTDVPRSLAGKGGLPERWSGRVGWSEPATERGTRDAREAWATTGTVRGGHGVRGVCRTGQFLRVAGEPAGRAVSGRGVCRAVRVGQW